MPPQIPVTIREATLADVPAMAEVTAAGFLDDDVFGNFIHPCRMEFPDSWNYSWQRVIRSHLTKASSRSYACVESTSDRVAAICLVTRLGDGASEFIDAETLSTKAQQAGVLPLNF
jgi:hypothetical protein